MSLQRRIAKLEAAPGSGLLRGEALRDLLRLTGWPDDKPIPDDCVLDLKAWLAGIAASPESSPMARLRATAAPTVAIPSDSLAINVADTYGKARG